MSRLTAAQVRSIGHSGRLTGNGRPRIERHYDQHGLYLQVVLSKTTVSKQWVQRLVLDGKRSDYGLGGVAELTLAEARHKALENVLAARAYRRARRSGEEPPLPGFEVARRNTVAARKGEERPDLPAHAGTTFEQVFERFLAARAPRWKASVRKTSVRSWRAHLRDYLQPIAKRPVAALTSGELQRCIEKIPIEKPKTAAKVLARVATVLEYAVASDLRRDNPARAVARTRPQAAHDAPKHYTALPHAEVADALERIAASTAHPALKGAIRLQALTAVRPGEARLARWEEVDLDAASWVIPSHRMKYPKHGEHRVPLSRQAIETLRAAGPRAEGPVFIGRTGKPPSGSAIRKHLATLGLPSPHGMRSSFRDMAADAGYSRELAEQALSHTVGGVEAAYRRTDLFERRRTLMQEWADYVCPQPTAETRGPLPRPRLTSQGASRGRRRHADLHAD